MPSHDHHHPPQPPKPNTKFISLLLKTIIMTLITSIFFLILGIASLFLLPLLFTSLHRHRHQHLQSDDLSNGFSSKDINKLPQFRFCKRFDTQLETDPECVVCLDGFRQGQWCRTLVGCGHVFHRKCVDTWLVKVAACPTCRTRVRLFSDDDRDIWDFGRMRRSNDLRVC